MLWYVFRLVIALQTISWLSAFINGLFLIYMAHSCLIILSMNMWKRMSTLLFTYRTDFCLSSIMLIKPSCNYNIQLLTLFPSDLRIFCTFYLNFQCFLLSPLSSFYSLFRFPMAWICMMLFVFIYVSTYNINLIYHWLLTLTIQPSICHQISLLNMSSLWYRTPLWLISV